MTFTRTAAPIALLLLALSGCASASPADDSAPAASESSAAEGCAEVTIVVDFGSLDADPVEACAPAGSAVDALDAAGITTEGTADYGDQVVCRVNDEPSPDVDSCATLSSTDYWALWLKPAPDEDWVFAQEGVSTLQVAAGESIGLVYTPIDGGEATPPQD